MGPKFKSGGGGIASRFGAGGLMVPSGPMAQNLSSSDMTFDNPGNSSGIFRQPDASFSSHNVSMMSDA
jgi:hypothetical protein